MSSSFIFKLSDIIKQWCDSGSSVLYFTTEREVKVESSRNKKDRDFLEIEMWLAVKKGQAKKMKKTENFI